MASVIKTLLSIATVECALALAEVYTNPATRTHGISQRSIKSRLTLNLHQHTDKKWWQSDECWTQIVFPPF